MIKNIRVKIIFLVLPFLLISCTYLKYASIQAEYSRIQNADPSQLNLKHMLDREFFFVYGKTVDDADRYSDISMAIVAYSSKFKTNERVDTMFFTGNGTHYGLTLPEGSYTLLVYADKNNDQVFNHTEVVGKREITLNTTSASEKNMGQVNIKLADSILVDWATPISMPENINLKQSLFYPTGTLRSIEDPIFDEKMSILGMYDPASFMEHAPTMFYALEEDLAYKIPVVFVHGANGSIRSFEPIIKRLDRRRYKPWFFYYPSGGDLEQLASFFYNIFLSGKVIPLGDMPLIVVAHSMGGLVIREAINKYQNKGSENKVKLLITIASPMGGHPSAASGEENGIIVLPAWRDLNPNNRFIKELYRVPLPSYLNHQLYYAYKNPSAFKWDENSDGVVPLSSQLHPEAQNQSQQQFGFNSSHTNILENEDMIHRLLEKIADVYNIYPKSHLEILDLGGFDVKLSNEYSPITKYLIRSVGKYFVALANKQIIPIYQSQTHFVQVIDGEMSASTDLEKELMMFMKEYPEIVNSVNEI